jgi:putative thioredoxin
MPATSAATPIIEVTEQTFAGSVIKRSYTMPVVVDFWAAWCGPCKMLGPVLEKLAAEYNGAFMLAKVDVDRNPGLAMQYGVQGIPAVKAFINGQVAHEFTGALPQARVRQFIQQIIPSPADLYAQQAYQWEVTDQPAMAIENYKAALEEQADHYPAILGLGRVLLKVGQVDEAVAVLAGIPNGVPQRIEADALLVAAEFRREATGQNETDVRADVETNPNNVAARYVLASMLAGQEKYAEALAQFLEVVRRDRTYKDDGARKAMLAIFITLGDDNPVTREYRRKLANALF